MFIAKFDFFEFLSRSAILFLYYFAEIQINYCIKTFHVSARVRLLHVDKNKHSTANFKLESVVCYKTPTLVDFLNDLPGTTHLLKTVDTVECTW